MPNDAHITGEPYSLRGTRLYFTSWSFVRPGYFSWNNEAGETLLVVPERNMDNGVIAQSRAYAGPWEGRFVSTGDAPRGVRFVVEKAKRVGPLLKAQSPWESERCIQLNCICQKGNIYQGWADGETPDGKKWNGYMESKDGYSWTRPALNLVKETAGGNNNLLPLAPASVFHDAHDPDPKARYKGVAEGVLSPEDFQKFKERHPDRWEHRANREDVGVYFALWGFQSPDGLRWERLEEPFTVEHTDTQTTLTRDPHTGLYRIYTRHYDVGLRCGDVPMAHSFHKGWLCDWGGAGRRAIGLTESEKFGDFPLSSLIITPAIEMGPQAQLYTNCYTTIPGAPDHHLMFPTIWDLGDDSTHLAMATSLNGKNWNWAGAEGILDTGQFGEFDGGCLFGRPNLLELTNGDFALPYTGYSFPHKYPRGQWSFNTGYALWPQGRLCGIEASEEGQFTTVSFVPPTNHVQINAAVRRGGFLRVEALQRDGTPLPGRTWADSPCLTGNLFKKLLEWKNVKTLSDDPEAPVCLRFTMRRARIYGLDFVEE